MFCTKCGANVPEDALFCGKCGSPMPQPAAPVVEPPVEAPVVEAPVVEETPVVEDVPYVPPMACEPEEVPAPEKKKSRKGLWAGLVALVCVAAIGVGSFLYFRPSEFHGMVMDVMNVKYEMDISNLKEMAPSQAWEKLKKEYKVTIDELMTGEEYVTAAKHLYGLDEEVTDALGSNIQYTVKVLRESDVPAKGREDILSALQKGYDIPPSLVGDMRMVYCEVTLSGEVDTEYQLTVYIAVEINDTWYLTDGDRFVAERMASNIAYEVKCDDVLDDSELEF